MANSDNNNGKRNNDGNGERVKAFVARAQSQTGTGGDNDGVRGFVARAESSIAESGGENRGDNRNDNRGGRNNRHGGNFGRGPVRKNNPGGQGQNRGPRDVRENRDNRDRTGGSNGPRPDGQPGDNQGKNQRHGKPDRGPKPVRENFDGIVNRRPARGAKEETLEDIQKDIAAIEKEIELEISDISVMKLNV